MRFTRFRERSEQEIYLSLRGGDCVFPAALRDSERVPSPLSLRGGDCVFPAALRDSERVPSPLSLRGALFLIGR